MPATEEGVPVELMAAVVNMVEVEEEAGKEKQIHLPNLTKTERPLMLSLAVKIPASTSRPTRTFPLKPQVTMFPKPLAPLVR